MTKAKRSISLVILMVILIASFLTPIAEVYAASNGIDEFDAASSEFIKDAEEARDILTLLDKDARAFSRPDRDSVSFLMRRVFYPGYYANDVRDAIIARGIKVKKDDLLHDGIHACNPNAPNNLINHNCNIPNFTTGLIQNVSEPFMSPFTNAEKSSAYAVFGLGVPANIPGEIVPADPSERSHTYTALELFGYDLKLTSYSGEWDQIMASNSARMLSNFGVIDRITFAGTAIWNSYKSGISSFVTNFSFNPLRWYGGISKVFEGIFAAGLNTFADTSELNIIATNAWKRPNIDKTLYNIYVMSDREILIETAKGYFEVFSKELDIAIQGSEKLKKVLNMEPGTALAGIEFEFDPKMETEKSKKARDSARKDRNKIREKNREEEYKAELSQAHGGKEYKPNIKPLPALPKPVYYTESEQMGIWSEEPAVADVLYQAGFAALIKDDVTEYGSYEDLINDWSTNYGPYFDEHFDAKKSTIAKILEETDSNVFQKYPHLDPKQGISKYACANDDGSIMRDSEGKVEYLYTANNNGSEQFINPLCGEVRAPIGGGLLGTGWEDKEIKDTRHISNVSSESLIMDKIKNITTSFIRSLNIVIAKFTNSVLNLAFKPLLSELGIDTIIAKTIDNFKNTIFFPLAGLAASIGAVLMFFQLLRNGSALQLLSSIMLTFIVFVAGTVFLLHPKSTVSMIDTLPNSIDNFVASSILGGESTSYCSTGEDVSGIRSAQCSIWGAMVFEPWVHLQFGTGYDNLYANGKQPPGSNSFKNTNESLVGDAAVDMGNGKVEHNWALYQLSKTKSGTINQHDNLEKIGTIDKDMYRLVDLQAGPNYGAGADGRYFADWSGARNGGFLLFLTTVQAAFIAIVVTMLAFMKIEVSFMFSISLLFFPVMLLYALTPQGRGKFVKYVSGLVTLLFKRVVIVLMISVMLKMIVTSYSKSSSLESAAFISIFIAVAFMLYRKEIMSIITSTESQGLLSGETGQLKEAAGKLIPNNIKQSLKVKKANVKGAAVGFTGGAIGAIEDRAEIGVRRAGIATTLAMLNMKEKRKELTEKELLQKEFLENERMEIKQISANRKNLSPEKINELEEERREALDLINYYQEQINEEEELARKNNALVDKKKIEKLKKEIEYRQELADLREKEIISGSTSGDSIYSQAKKGAAHSKSVIGRVSERKVRAEGYAALSAYRDVQEKIYSEGARKISEAEDSVAHDTYREILSNTKREQSKANQEIKGSEYGDLMKPKIQKKIRQIAKETKKDVEKNGYSDAIYSDSKKKKKTIRTINRKRAGETFRAAIKNPLSAISSVKDNKKTKEETLLNSSKVKDIRSIIEEDIKKGRKPDEVLKGENKEKTEVFLERSASASKKVREQGEKDREELKSIKKDFLKAKERKERLQKEADKERNQKMKEFNEKRMNAEEDEE